MSFLPSLRASTRLSRPASIVPRTFHTSAVRPGLKEGDQSRDELNQHYENEKQEQIKRQKSGQGKWNQNLASNSEASVKADRGDINSKDDFVDLQDKTKNEPNKKA
ncbi:hypothetical protein BDV18DRAFT_135823 [Aspergillus unguis]